MTLHLLCSGGRKGGKKREKERKTVFCSRIKRCVQAECLDEMAEQQLLVSRSHQSYGWHSRASEASALTDVQIIELSILPNYQSCIKIIHLLVNIKHIMSLLCVLVEVGKVKHSM